MKGYCGHRDDVAEENRPRIDYKLSHPTQFRVLKKGKGKPVEVPNFKTKPVMFREGQQVTYLDPKEPDNFKSASAQTDLKRLIG